MAYEELLSKIESAVAADMDLGWNEAAATKKAMEELFGYCNVTQTGVSASQDAPTRSLVLNWVPFVGAEYGVPGGSASDYAASATLSGMDDYNLVVVDPTAYSRLQDAIERLALEPSYIYEQLERNGAARWSSGTLGPC